MVQTNLRTKHERQLRRRKEGSDPNYYTVVGIERMLGESLLVCESTLGLLCPLVDSLAVIHFYPFWEKRHPIHQKKNVYDHFSKTTHMLTNMLKA